jgi:hypothetical protein
MNKQKIQAIFEKLPIEEEARSDFVVVLGDVHGQISAALGIARFQPGLLQEDIDDSGGYDEDSYPSGVDEFTGSFSDWEGTQLNDGDDDGDEAPPVEALTFAEIHDNEGDSEDEEEAFKQKVLTAFNSRFNEGGLLSAAKYLAIALEPAMEQYSVDINLDQINNEPEETLENVNFFIREYGVTDFFEHDFVAKLFFMDEEEEDDEPVGPRRIREEGREAIRPDSIFESLHEPHPSDAISTEIFEAVSGKFEDRQSNWPTEAKIHFRGSLTPDQAAFTSVDTTDKFFEAERSGNNYSDRLRAAGEEDNHITPLNFHPIFKRLGDKATGLMVDEAVDPPVVSFSLDKMTALIQAVGYELDTIKTAATNMQGRLTSAALKEEGRDLRTALTTYNKERRRLSNRVDDLLSAIKKRDAFVTDLLYKDYGKKRGFKVNKALLGRRYELSSEFRDEESTMATDLAFICGTLVFVDIMMEVFQLGEGEGSSIPTKFKEDYEVLSEVFQEIFMHQLHNKIRTFFSRNASGTWARSSFCSWVAREINRGMLCKLAMSRVYQTKQKYWNLSSCSVCGKNIYTRTATISPKQSGRKGAVEVSDYSEYDTPLYSLFTNGGGIITEDMLNRKEGGFPPPEDHPEYEGSKTWEGISLLMNSGDKDDHIEGIIRRAEALRQLDARRIGETDRPVSNKKYKCPWTNEGDRPPELLRSIEDAQRAGTKWNPKITNFECGLYLDPEPIIASGGSISPESLQMVRPPVEGRSRESFASRLDAAVADPANDLDASAKDKFMRELERRSGGGWKFSNKFFNCPTKINVPPEHRTAAAIKSQKYLSRYSYLASPISGPISAGSTAYTEDGHVDVERSRVYPPVGEDGLPSELTEGTLTYLVCGAKTSVSSFLREGEGSLGSAINTLMDKATLFSDERGAQGKEDLKVLIETFIDLGVDLNDILPFIRDPEKSPMDTIEALTKDISSAMSKPEPDVLAVLDNYNRLSKISQLLSVAMASPADLGKHIRGTNMSQKDAVGDIKLVCGHGHKFSIKDSLHFARTHTGINFNNRSKYAYDRNSVIASGVLFTDGSENFEATLENLRDKNGRSYIAVAKESDLIGPDATRKFEYDEWKGWIETKESRASRGKLKRLMFGGPEDEYYAFNAVPRIFAWGSEEGHKWSSAREKETADGGTRTYLESGAMMTGMGEKDSDGKYTSHDAEGAASYNLWKEKESESGDLVTDGDELPKTLAAEGIGALDKVMAPIGKHLRSFLLSMQGWLKLATTLEIQGSMTGSPEPITFRGIGFEDMADYGLKEDSSGSFGAVALYNSHRALDTIIKHNIEVGKAAPMTEVLLERSFSYFRETYLNQLESADSRMLYHAAETVREFLAVGMVKSILRSIPEVYEDRAGEIARFFRKDFTRGGAVNYSALFETGTAAGASAGSFINDIIAKLKPPALSEKDRARILMDPLATGRGSNWYEGGRPTGTKEGVSPSVAKMKGKEYMGRTLEGASALYVADVMSSLYNLHMRDEYSPSYIGYNIGLDLSTPEKVLALTHDDLSNIVIGISQDEYNERYKKEDDLVGFYRQHRTPISECREAFQAAVFSLRTACTSAKYMKKSTEYITGFLSDMVDAASEKEEPDTVEKARLIIDNIMTNSPFTTIDLSSDGKYRKYHGGSDAIDAESIVPSFASMLVNFNSDKQGAIYPIYKLLDHKGSYHSFDIDIEFPVARGAGSRECYVLSKEDLPGSAEELDLNEALPDVYKRSGWRVFSVTMGRGPTEYSDLTGAGSGWMEGVSLAYHPGTSGVRGEHEKIIGYRNDELGLNSSEALFVGPLTVRRGNKMVFPPDPYEESHVGIPIPVDYKGADTTSSRPVFPIVGTKVPVEINSSESDAPTSVDMSTFLQRDPPKEALKILFRIEELYDAYKEKLVKAEEALAAVTRLSLTDRRRSGAIAYYSKYRDGLKAQYKSMISGLHSTYRGLPINVASGNISTVKDRRSIGIHSDLEGSAERLRPRSSLYLPLVDWVTMHRMMSSEAFGPEWGGHQLWPEGDDELKNRRKEAVEEFLIKTYNLNTLAREIGLKLDAVNSRQRGSTVVDPLDLMDPIKRLVGGGIVSQKNIRAVFGQTTELALTELNELTGRGMAWVDTAEKLSMDPDIKRQAEKKNITPRAMAKAKVNDRKKNVGKSMLENYPSWVKGQGSFFPVGSSSKRDSITEDPSAYIKIMNVVFPSNAVGSKGISPRESLDRARDPDSSDILSFDHLYSHTIISGVQNEPNPDYFPLPGDEKGLKKYLKSLKKVKHISVARYAEAISEYLAAFIERDLEPPLEGGIKEAVSSFGLVKFSEKRNANMYYGGIINDEGLLALWNLINK